MVKESKQQAPINRVKEILSPYEVVKTADGEIHLRGDKIVARVVVAGRITRYYKGSRNVFRNPRDGPALIETNENGVVTREEYIHKGVWSRALGPAVIWRNDQGRIIREMYYNKGFKDRAPAEGPACTIFDNAGTPVLEEFRVNDALHNDSGPAYIERDSDARVVYVAWYRDGKRHRAIKDGPAVVQLLPSGVKEEWYVDGEPVTGVVLENIKLHAALEEVSKKLAELQMIIQKAVRE
jgi:hypothetical protein